MSPQRVRSAEFKTARKGADPDEVKAFLNDVADELERAQNQSTAMEARARAAIARLQEMNDGSRAPAAAPSAPEASPDEAETISRTLLLAQRTADSTVAEARAEAARIVQAANSEASTTLDSAREMSTRLVEEARANARQAGESERITVAGEVDALKARRDFLESDVEQLELFLTDQRARLREAATSLVDITERIPGGLGEVRAPLLSASDDDDDEERQDDDAHDVADGEAVAAPEPVEAPDASPDVEQPGADAAVDDLVIVTDLAGDDDGADRTEPPAGDGAPADRTVSWARDGGDETQAYEVPVADERRDEDILFSFDDDRR
jgi:cell division initiation protein